MTRSDTFHADGVRRLYEVTRRVISSTDLAEVLEEIAQGVVEGLGYGVAAISRLEGDTLVMTAVAGPEIHARGFAEDDSTFDAIRQPIVDALDRAVADGVDDSYQLQQTVRRVVGRWVNNTHRRRPMIIPVVIEA